jgi:hypothetical protein
MIGKPQANSFILFSVFAALHTCIDSLVLAYPCKTEPSLLLPGLKELWQVLEEYVDNQKLISIGVSDVETDVFIALHGWARVGKQETIPCVLIFCLKWHGEIIAFIRASFYFRFIHLIDSI